MYGERPRQTKNDTKRERMRVEGRKQGLHGRTERGEMIDIQEDSRGVETTHLTR